MRVYLAEDSDIWDYDFVDESLHGAQEEIWYRRERQRKVTNIKYVAVLNENGEPVIQKERKIEYPFGWFDWGKNHGEDDYDMWRDIPYSVFYLEFNTLEEFEIFFSECGLELIKGNEHLILVLE